MTGWTPGTACLDLVCPRCEAKPGQRCTTINGSPTVEPHVSRWNPLATAYGNGYADGIAAKSRFCQLPDCGCDGRRHA